MNCDTNSQDTTQRTYKFYMYIKRTIAQKVLDKIILRNVLIENYMRTFFANKKSYITAFNMSVFFA